MIKFAKVAKRDVEPGDRALHKSGELDSRPVVAIQGNVVWLRFFNSIATMPADNYTYTRAEEVADDA